jgi:hypothetical protein
MPLIVTDSDVLAEITKVSGLVASIDAALTALGSKVPAATAACWAGRKAAWTAWSGPIVPELSSFWTGWFGIPELGDQAVAWEEEMNNWQTIANQIAAGAANIPACAQGVGPIAVADQNANLAPVVGGPGAPGAPGGLPAGVGSVTTGLVIGIAATAALVLLVRR